MWLRAFLSSAPSSSEPYGEGLFPRREVHTHHHSHAPGGTSQEVQDRVHCLLGHSVRGLLEPHGQVLVLGGVSKEAVPDLLDVGVEEPSGGQGEAHPGHAHR